MTAVSYQYDIYQVSNEVFAELWLTAQIKLPPDFPSSTGTYGNRWVPVSKLTKWVLGGVTIPTAELV